MSRVLKDWGVLMLLLLLLILGLGRCFRTDQEPKISHLKSKIQNEVEKQQEIKKEVKIKDSVRIVYVDRWHKVKTNPEKLPCDTFVKVLTAACDTVIVKDSLEIEALKKLVMQDSVIIGDQSKLIKEDSVKIFKLNRKLRFQKGLTKVSFFVGAALGGAAGYKLP